MSKSKRPQLHDIKAALDREPAAVDEELVRTSVMLPERMVLELQEERLRRRRLGEKGVSVSSLIRDAVDAMLTAVRSK